MLQLLVPAANRLRFSPMTKIVNLNDLFPGKVSVQQAQHVADTIQAQDYADCDVQLRGCAPTWAHLMVAGKLFATAQSISFVIDDGKGGLPVLVYKKPSA